jgi:RNA polymerase sigma factor (sigma-70 family)
MAKGGDEARMARRQAVMAIVQRGLHSECADTVATFEKTLNDCLDVGYRAQPLAAFVFDVLHRRLAGRVRRRLAQSGRHSDSDEVSDLVGAAAEAIQKLIRGARRERHTLRYALLLSIADHRAIDFLRRRRPEYRETMDDDTGGTEAAPWAMEVDGSPEQMVWRAERLTLAEALQRAVLDVVNGLPTLERAALVLVEIEGLGYPEVSEALGLKQTDVGNIVRRARLKRDRLLVPRLRKIPGFDGHLGFGEMQRNRALRLNMLGWAADIGDGVCLCCKQDGYLHPLAQACAGHA